MAKDLFEEAGANAATDLFAEAGIKFEPPRKKEEPIDLGFTETDIKQARQQLREPIIGLPRRQPPVAAPPVVAPPAPPAPVEGLGALMANVPKQKALPSATLPVTPEELRRIKDM